MWHVTIRSESAFILTPAVLLTLTADAPPCESEKMKLWGCSSELLMFSLFNQHFVPLTGTQVPPLPPVDAAASLPVFTELFSLLFKVLQQRNILVSSDVSFRMMLASHLHKNDPSFLLWAWQTPSPAYTEEKKVLTFKIKHKIHEMRSKDDLILHSVHSVAAWLQSHLTASPGKKAKTCLLPTSTSELPTQWNISIYLEYLHTSPWFPHFTSDWGPIRPWETY